MFSGFFTEQLAVWREMHGFLPLTRFIKLRDKICSLAFAMQQTPQIVGASNRDSLILMVSRAAVWLPLCGLTRAHPCSFMRVADGFAGAEGPGLPTLAGCRCACQLRRHDLPPWVLSSSTGLESASLWHLLSGSERESGNCRPLESQAWNRYPIPSAIIYGPKQITCQPRHQGAED